MRLSPRSRGALSRSALLLCLLLSSLGPARSQSTVGTSNQVTAPLATPTPATSTNFTSTYLVLPSTNAFQPSTNGLVASTNRLSETRNVRPRFRPVTQPVPAVRLTGGTRGTGTDVVTLDVLAPPDVGLTTREQPTLYWFQSQPSSARLELAVLQDNQVEPLCHLSFDHASQAGIQRFDLAAHGARLIPGVEYQWIVALVSDPDHRSTDLVASGFIKLVEPNAEVQTQILAATPDTLPSVLAENGFWYDAIAELSRRLETQPDHAAAHARRTELLRQAGLVTPALLGAASPEPGL